ncbi:MAG: DEAD/DEAH box helicase, partial [Acidobacteriota bacterium]|nr:DEAD/DEAH box helicase [Acidobacteriota bacterium]
MPQDFLERCLLLDLETGAGQKILKIGAVYRGQTFERQGAFRLPQALEELDGFAAGADFVLGHNVLRHDLPILARWAPRLGLLGKPVIDTLVLSPLAFPENPYHRLVKGYKLIHDSQSDPLADARLAAKLFVEQWKSFAALSVIEPERPAFYAFCFGDDGDGGQGHGGRSGFGGVFSAHSQRPPMTTAEAGAYLAASLDGQVCRTALAALLACGGLERSGQRAAWGFAVSWLRVAGGGSVLPRWVTEQYPETVELLDALRCRPCGDSGCAYCRADGDLEEQLRHFFDLPGFRPLPASLDGGSLQKVLVRHALDAKPLLAILPTGGGKSLCYQLPALVRHRRRGLLTLIISPLQALMQDQVEQLNHRTGLDRAAAINGLLTPPERGAILERVRLGEVALLYVSPEQLRNRSFQRAITQRELGGWVFDEAHCLSKWGHDFRPDYLYAGRFIRELAARQRQPPPPVTCFTATAKPDVQQEIADHFRRELEVELMTLGGNRRRAELEFQVEAATPTAKLTRIHALLAEHLRAAPEAAAVVYFA